MGIKLPNVGWKGEVISRVKGLGHTHIIGNGELMSAGRRAGIQTWAHQGYMIRLVEGCSHSTPVPSPCLAHTGWAGPGAGLRGRVQLETEGPVSSSLYCSATPESQLLSKQGK